MGGTRGAAAAPQLCGRSLLIVVCWCCALAAVGCARAAPVSRSLFTPGAWDCRRFVWDTNSGCDCDTLLDGAYIRIVGGYDPARDELVCDTCESDKITPVWKRATGVFEIIGRVRMVELARMVNSMRLEAGWVSADEYVVTANLGHALYDPESRAFFMYVSGDVSWAAAQENAAAYRELLGLVGYLATPLAAHDMDVIAALDVSSSGWLGGTSYGSDPARPVFRWATGPSGCGHRPSKTGAAVTSCDIFPIGPSRSSTCAQSNPDCARGRVFYSSPTIPSTGGLYHAFDTITEPNANGNFVAASRNSTGGYAWYTYPNDGPVDGAYVMFTLGIGTLCVSLQDIARTVQLPAQVTAPKPVVRPTTLLPVTAQPPPPQPTAPAATTAPLPTPAPLPDPSTVDECTSPVSKVCTIDTAGNDGPKVCEDVGPRVDTLGDWLCRCTDDAPFNRIGFARDIGCGDFLDECCDRCTCSTCANTTCSDAFQGCMDPVPTTASLQDWYCVCVYGAGTYKLGAAVPVCTYDECTEDPAGTEVCGAAGQSCVDPTPVHVGHMRTKVPRRRVLDIANDRHQLGRGEGHCDSDNDCRIGLVCVHRQAAGEIEVPGVEGLVGQWSTYNICAYPYRMPAGSKDSTLDVDLQIGDRDCMVAECAGWLLCQWQPDFPSWPMFANADWRTGYCFAMGTQVAASPGTGGLLAGEGPCASHADCTGGLRCFFRHRATNPVFAPPGVDVHAIPLGLSVCYSPMDAFFDRGLSPGVALPPTLGDWVCTCRAPSVGEATPAAPASCLLDECVTACGSCANGACGEQQLCEDPAPTPTDIHDWTCRCRVPPIATAVRGPAACPLDECDATVQCATCRTEALCPDADYACTDDGTAVAASLGDWRCACRAAPEVVGVGRAPEEPCAPPATFVPQPPAGTLEPSTLVPPPLVLPPLLTPPPTWRPATAAPTGGGDGSGGGSGSPTTALPATIAPRVRVPPGGGLYPSGAPYTSTPLVGRGPGDADGDAADGDSETENGDEVDAHSGSPDEIGYEVVACVIGVGVLLACVACGIRLHMMRAARLAAEAEAARSVDPVTDTSLTDVAEEDSGDGRGGDAKLPFPTVNPLLDVFPEYANAKPSRDA